MADFEAGLELQYLREKYRVGITQIRCICYGRRVGVKAADLVKRRLALIARRFWERVDKSGDCWVWKGPLNVDGYGYLKVGGKFTFAHRLSLELSDIKVPDDLLSCHHCDNPPCVRPGHLYLGTVKQNTQDAIKRGQIQRDRSGRVVGSQRTTATTQLSK